MENKVSEVTRRSIFDRLSTSGIIWAGRLDEDDFLARLYDLTEYPSTDPRFSNAAGDIHQHRVGWDDWGRDWIFTDDRFNLLRCPDSEFLRFLCEMAHPVVRPDEASAKELVELINDNLKADGWQIVPGKSISGKATFVAVRAEIPAEVFQEPTGWQKVDRQLQEARLRLDQADSEVSCQAVGLMSREILISLAQEVFDPEKHKTIDGVSPSSTDAGRMLEAFFAAELAGGGNDEARSHAKAALKLAVALQHRRTATFQLAALCAEATASVVRVVAVLAGKRGRSL